MRIRKPENAIIGDHSIIDDFTYISCDIGIGAYCHIGSNTNFVGGRGRVTLGDFVAIASGCSIYTATNDYINASLDSPAIPEEFRFGGIVEEVIIGDHVMLGSHTVVLPGAHLPEGFASAAHTVVRKYRYEPWTLYTGFECKKLIRRNHAKLSENIQEIKTSSKD